MRDVSGRQRGVVVGQSPLMDRVNGATAVEQRIFHVRSVEAAWTRGRDICRSQQVAAVRFDCGVSAVPGWRVLERVIQVV